MGLARAGPMRRAATASVSGRAGTGGSRARGDAPCARLAASRAWVGPVAPRGQAGVIRTEAGVVTGSLEPIAVCVHLQDMDMVGDAVEERADEALAGEDRGSFLEGQV